MEMERGERKGMNFGKEAMASFFFNTLHRAWGVKHMLSTLKESAKTKGGERGLCREGGIKGAEKWNKNRLMMELVSRWGSPLTSEAPHSLAYPSPVKRRGHTTDLSPPAKSSSGEPLPHLPIPPIPLSYSSYPVAVRPTSSSALLMTGQPPSRCRRRSTEKPPARCLKPSAIFSAARSAWCRYSKTQCGSRLATEPEAWHLNCPGNIAAHCRVGSINHTEFWGPTQQTQTWQEVREVAVKFHRFAITSCHPPPPGLSLQANWKCRSRTKWNRSNHGAWNSWLSNSAAHQRAAWDELCLCSRASL